MGWFKTKDEEEKVEERKELRAQVRKLKDEIADLECKKRMEIEEIKHLNRLAQEKRDIELEREKSKIKTEYAEKHERALLDHKDDLNKRQAAAFDSVVKLLEKHNTEMKDVTTSVYKDIIARLPNVNVTMKR